MFLIDRIRYYHCLHQDPRHVYNELHIHERGYIGRIYIMVDIKMAEMDN